MGEWEATRHTGSFPNPMPCASVCRVFPGHRKGAEQQAVEKESSRQPNQTAPQSMAPCAAAAAAAGRLAAAALLLASLLVLAVGGEAARSAEQWSRSDAWRQRRGLLHCPASAPQPAPAAGYPFTVTSECWAEVQLYLLFPFDAAVRDPLSCLNVPEPRLCQQYVALAPGATVAAAHPSTSPTAWLVSSCGWSRGRRVGWGCCGAPCSPAASLISALPLPNMLTQQILEDDDALPLPVGYTEGDGLSYATVENIACTEGTEDCLPKFQVQGGGPYLEAGPTGCRRRAAESFKQPCCRPRVLPQVDVSGGSIVLACDERLSAPPPSAGLEAAALVAEAPAPAEA